ncbi:MAG: HAD hydrolase family protein [Deltaproteobacteria bacterium]|jgi:3-deoxy-D-manno-octulosonate 8-phosphate phosphatase (KDO 8-P phosphatase)|nr:HAD hydrolase family protein [Deltaproteobacteria bacterium]
MPVEATAAICSDQAANLARRIRMVVLDVDGVMTDGGLHYDAEGRITKRYHVHDGVGIMLLRQAGLKVAVITAGRDGPCVASRMRRLQVDAFYEGDVSKRAALEDLRARFDLVWKEMAYLGDDWVDLIPLGLVGLPMAVCNARREVKACAHYVTKACGGDGAVREAAEWLLACQGSLEAVLAQWTTPDGTGDPGAGDV